MSIKKAMVLAGALAAGTLGTQAQALEQGDWIVRVGPTLIAPNDDSGALDTVPGSEVGVDEAWTLGFTIGHMVTDNVSVDLLGVYPAEHDLTGEGSISGLGTIADVDVLPPTLTLNYHFNPTSSVRPFVGAGINYTYFSGESESTSLKGLDPINGDVELDIDSSIGLAAAAGIDVDINNDWFLNATVWYVDIDADATVDVAGTDLDVDVDIDPWVVMFAVGTTF